MARVKKQAPTLEGLMFSTPEQKVLRFLLGEPTTTFTPRVISSKLKGVRGLGGADGIVKILGKLEEVGVVDFLDNRRSVRLHDEHSCIKVLKVLATICDLHNLKTLLLPISAKGFLHGDRATGKSHSESEYELYVVSDLSDDVRRVTAGFPLGKVIQLTVKTPREHEHLEEQDRRLYHSLSKGVQLWGSLW